MYGDLHCTRHGGSMGQYELGESSLDLRYKGVVCNSSKAKGLHGSVLGGGSCYCCCWGGRVED
jgi:hypothetical protein